MCMAQFLAKSIDEGKLTPLGGAATETVSQKVLEKADEGGASKVLESVTDTGASKATKAAGSSVNNALQIARNY